MSAPSHQSALLIILMKRSYGKISDSIGIHSKAGGEDISLFFVSRALILSRLYHSRGFSPDTQADIFLRSLLRV